MSAFHHHPHHIIPARAFDGYNQRMEALIDTEWLAGELGAPDLRVVDATYHPFPGEPPRDAAAEYAAAHIPGALFLDLASLRDTDSDLPMMLPDADSFAVRMAALGIANGTRVVLYDDDPHRTAARAWWMLRSFGVERVAILDGGLARWRAEGRVVRGGTEPAPPPAGFTARLDPATLRLLDQMRTAAADGGEQIVDARSPARFTGAEADPRPNTAAGHIPGSLNLPYLRLFAAAGCWKRGAELRAAFEASGVDPDRPMAMTCGSGVTASVLAFAAHLLGREAAVYDGSWSEWGSRDDTPKASATDVSSPRP